MGCGDYRLLTLRRLPGALVVGYEVGADRVTRVYGKLVGEFFEALNRVVVGAEVLVNDRFTKPDDLVGPYFIVAVAGAVFGYGAAEDDHDLLAVDLSTSGIRILSNSAFSGCSELAAVAFPPELESIGGSCFSHCDALHVIDLGATLVKMLGLSAFSGCGVTRVSIPASLRRVERNVFVHTPLKILDLSACGGIRVDFPQPNSLVELSLPREGFAGAAMAFLPGSAIEVIQADVGEAEINELFPHFEGWGLNKLRIVSQRVGEYEWQRAEQSALVKLTDSVAVTTPATVTMTAWRELPDEWKPFLRSIDLSGLVLELLPDGATLEGLFSLEGAALPTGLRVLPQRFFRGCLRLASIDTRYTALEEIEADACEGCGSLAAFVFPPTIRRLGYAFGSTSRAAVAFPSTVRQVTFAFEGTSITTLDLSETVAEEVWVYGMVSLVDIVLPRRCVLRGGSGVPSLRCVTFGTTEDGGAFAWHPTEVRFDSLAADAEFSPGLLEARLYGEVACELGRETIPFPPP
jgi:hypothetical protein